MLTGGNEFVDDARRLHEYYIEAERQRASRSVKRLPPITRKVPHICFSLWCMGSATTNKMRGMAATNNSSVCVCVCSRVLSPSARTAILQVSPPPIVGEKCVVAMDAVGGSRVARIVFAVSRRSLQRLAIFNFEPVSSSGALSQRCCEPVS